jgi:fatty acid-binding protein DegV
MSVGWQVLAAARSRDAGADMKTILDQVDRVRRKLVQLVGMDTLKYL